MNWKHGFIVLLFVTGFLFSGCSSSGGDGGGTAIIEVSRLISATNGDKITSGNGKLTLDIPAGAIEADTTITIKQIDSSSLPSEFSNVKVGAAFELSPDGLTFAKPVTITLDTGASATDANGNLVAEASFLITNSKGINELLGDIALDVNTDSNLVRLSGKLGHFSKLIQTAEKNDNIKLSFDVPSRVQVGDEFKVRVVDLDQIFVARVGIEHIDQSRLPLETSQKNQLINFFNIDSSRDIVGYKCNKKGIGAYKARVEIRETTELGLKGLAHILGNDLVNYTVNVTSAIECVTPTDTQSRVVSTGLKSISGVNRLEGLAVFLANPELQILLAQGLGIPANPIIPLGIAHDGGVVVVDFITLRTIFQVAFNGILPYGMNLLDVNPKALFAYTNQDAFIFEFDTDTNTFFEFGRSTRTNLSDAPGNITDANAIGGGSAGLVFVNNTSGGIGYVLLDTTQTPPSFDVDPGRALPASAFQEASGNLVAAYAHNPDGPVLAVADGGPGELFFHPRGAATTATKIGQVGNNPRRIRCIIPICVVSNFGSDTLTIITWDGSANPPTIVRSVPVGDGPLGIDLRQNAGAFFVVINPAIKHRVYTA